MELGVIEHAVSPLEANIVFNIEPAESMREIREACILGGRQSISKMKEVQLKEFRYSKSYAEARKGMLVDDDRLFSVSK